MSNIQIYSDKKQELSDIAFVKDTPNQVKIRDIKDSLELVKQMTYFIALTAESLNIKEAVEDFHKKDIKALILFQFKGLSFDELHYAFKLERFGELGEKSQHYQCFGSEYVGEVLRKYVTWKKNIKTWNNIGKKQETPELSDGERARIREQFLRNVFQELCENGYSPDAWLLFEDLEKPDKMQIGKSRKKEIYQNQLNKYLQEKKVNNAGSKSVKEEIKKIKRQAHKGDSVPAVVIRSKAFSVCQYLKDFTGSFEEFKREIER